MRRDPTCPLFNDDLTIDPDTASGAAMTAEKRQMDGEDDARAARLARANINPTNPVPLRAVGA